MNFNEKKYYIAADSRLTELEKLQLAKDLLELERRGVLEYRAGAWGLAADVEIEETVNGPVTRFRKTEDAVPDREGSSSPNSDDQDSKQ